MLLMIARYASLCRVQLLGVVRRRRSGQLPHPPPPPPLQSRGPTASTDGPQPSCAASSGHIQSGQNAEQLPSSRMENSDALAEQLAAAAGRSSRRGQGNGAAEPSPHSPTVLELVVGDKVRRCLVLLDRKHVYSTERHHSCCKVPKPADAAGANSCLGARQATRKCVCEWRGRSGSLPRDAPCRWWRSACSGRAGTAPRSLRCMAPMGTSSSERWALVFGMNVKLLHLRQLDDNHLLLRAR